MGTSAPVIKEYDIPIKVPATEPFELPDTKPEIVEEPEKVPA